MISNLINRKIFTLLKVQYSNMLEYRVEIALWAISGIIPFFMLNIWTNNNLNESINISDILLSRYFLCAFFVRQFSVVWVVFSFEEDSLMGKVSPYLIQPLNPFFRYFAQHLAEQITRFPFAIIIAFFFFVLLLTEKPAFFNLFASSSVRQTIKISLTGDSFFIN